MWYCFSITTKQPHTSPILCSNPCTTATLKARSQQLPAVQMTNTGTRQETDQTVDRDTGQLFQARRPCTIHYICSYACAKAFNLNLEFSKKCKGGITTIIIYLFSVNTFTPIERCAIIFVIAQAEKLLIGQKLQNCARCNSSLIGQ